MVKADVPVYRKLRDLQFLPDRIICNSYAIAQRFFKKSGLPSKIRVIKNGVDTEKFNPKRTDKISRQDFQFNGGKIVGLVSNLSKRKIRPTIQIKS